MEALKAKSDADLVSFRDSFAQRISSIDEYLQSNFTFASLAAAEDAFNADVSSSNGKAKQNDTMVKLIGGAREELSQAIATMRVIEKWIMLSVPPVEDGNNFGVGVQHHVLKAIQTLREEMKKEFDGLTSYRKERGDMWAKVGVQSSSETKTSKSTKTSEGGKEPGSTVDTSNSSDESQKTLPNNPDLIAAIAEHDAKWYFNSQSIFANIRDTLIVIEDLISKNTDKLSAPKGSSRRSDMMFQI